MANSNKFKKDNYTRKELLTILFKFKRDTEIFSQTKFGRIHLETTTEEREQIWIQKHL